MSTKTKFKIFAVTWVFLLGMFYGGLLEHWFTEIPMFTCPATVEELAKFRAASTKPALRPVKVQDVATRP
jgi:uncharacterized membrane protein YoaK (UPF0700 family)